MDLVVAQRYLRRITYRPGWSFELYQGEFEGPHICINAKVMDSYHPGEETVLDIHSPVPLAALETESALLRYLAWRLQIIETHEMREWLKMDGAVIFDPHADHAAQDRPIHES